MKLISIFDFGIGGLILLTLVCLGLAGWFLFQAIRTRTKSQGTSQQTPSGIVYTNDKTPFYKIHTTWFCAAMIVAYVVILLMIRSDYRLHKQKDGVPREQTDSSRVAAEDQLK